MDSRLRWNDKVKKDNKLTGNRGEDLAADYLQKKGYKIEERNFRTRFGEIDIICWDGPILVFVEVKTKIGHDFGEPEEMVNKNKLGQVQRMGEVYVEMNVTKLKKSKTQNSEFNFMDSRLRGNDKLDSDQGQLLTPGPGEGWKGQCRVDVVAIVLTSDNEVENLQHYEAVY